MIARELFIAADGRPHPPWRVLLFLGLCVLCVIVATIMLRPFFNPLHQVTGIGGTGAAYTATIALLLAHWMTFETFDKKSSWAFVGLSRDRANPRALTTGTLFGAIPIGIASLLLLAAGLMTIEQTLPGSWAASAARVALVLLPAAFYEELLVRGYAFATLSEWLGAPGAIALTSVAFGLLHIPNPGTASIPILVVTIAGVYLAIILLATRSLYAAWLAHAAWNFVQAAVLHVPVSGLPMSRPNYQLVETGPDWLTGGEWGPEGGLVAAAAVVALIAFMRTKRFGLWAVGSGTQSPPPKAQSTQK